MTTFVPAEPFLPGEYIKMEMDARGWTHDDLADVIGISRRQVINLVQGKSGITPETALSLADAFPGQDARTWMGLQTSYELALAAKKDRDVKRRATIFEKAPVRELKRRNWIPDAIETGALEEAVCRFLRIPNIDVSPEMCVASRKGTDYGSYSAAEIAWYCRARELAEGCPAGEFSSANLDDGIAELLKLAAYPEDARTVPSVLRDMGIRMVMVQHLKGTRIDGVAFWLDDSSPAIALSARYDRIDNFWFTMLHELAHIKRKDKSPLDVDLKQVSDGLPHMEMRANRTASNILIPHSKLESFIQRNKPLYYQSKVVQFAQARGVHPGIVVGQLQARGELTYQQMRKLLVKVREFPLETALHDGWGSAPKLA